MYGSSLSQKSNLTVSFLLAGLTSVVLLYYSFRPGKPDPTSTKLLQNLTEPKNTNDNDDGEGNDSEDDTDSTSISENLSEMVNNKNDKEVISPQKTTSKAGSEHTPLTSNATPSTDAFLGITGENIKSKVVSLHSQIEAIDKRGKVLFKTKNFMEAADVFTEALDLIDQNVDMTDKESSRRFNSQVVTLTNNRSAMYEKAGLPDIALYDCDTILSLDAVHFKARTRKLRILESLNRHSEALVEVCCLQLTFMQDNRDKLRMGIPVMPPVPQSKLEELMAHILPKEIEVQLAKNEAKFDDGMERPLPSNYTIIQLLQSFGGYNTWMAAAARDGNLDILTAKIDVLDDQKKSQKVDLLLKRGRRYAYHHKFQECIVDVEESLAILKGDEITKYELEGTDTNARLWEWAGMCRHLKFDLEGASSCYDTCSKLEPDNVEILVKHAGVMMDAGKQEDAQALFDKALFLDPTATDALLHRANLCLLQQNPELAKADLEKCLELRPDYTIARLRLATVLMAMEEMSEAKKCLVLAERIDPQSSEVHSYRGEISFSQRDFVEASAEFNLAIKCDVDNPMPYVNLALAIMNTPSAGGGPPDIPEAIRLFEKALEIDPLFQQAYVHLGQLKLSLAQDLTTAKKVVAMYDQGIGYCRSADEMRDIVSMKMLAIAQIDAAKMLQMETLAIS